MTRKNKVFWVLILAAIIAVCLVAEMMIRGAENPSRFAGIYRDGELLYTIDLRGSTPREYEITGANGGRNVVRADGNASVYMAESNCRDGYCVRRGAVGGGAPIVCLPNRVVIKLTDYSADVDAATGAG